MDSRLQNSNQRLKNSDKIIDPPKFPTFCQFWSILHGSVCERCAAEPHAKYSFITTKESRIFIYNLRNFCSSPAKIQLSSHSCLAQGFHSRMQSSAEILFTLTTLNSYTMIFFSAKILQNCLSTEGIETQKLLKCVCCLLIFVLFEKE